MVRKTIEGESFGWCRLRSASVKSPNSLDSDEYKNEHAGMMGMFGA